MVVKLHDSAAQQMPVQVMRPASLEALKLQPQEGNWKLQLQQKQVVGQSLALEREGVGPMEDQIQQAAPWEDPETSW